MRKIIGLVICMCLCFLFFSGTAAAEVDYEHTYSDVSGDVGNSDIDITSVSSTESGANVVLTVVVAGTIDTTTASYMIDTIVDGVSGYTFIYSYGVASGTVSVDSDVSGSTLTFTVAKTALGATTSFDINYAQTSDSAYNMDFAGEGNGNGDNGGEETVDPSTETPTDTSISITMSIDFDYEEGDTTVTFDFSASGTTSGVHHCSLCSVTYYDDGTTEVSDWADGPIPEYTWGGVTFKFVSTSDSDWKTWEYSYNGTMSKSDWEGSEWEEEGKEATKTIIYVRAYSDSAEENWNQASKTVTFEEGGAVVTNGDGENGEKKEEKGFIPGFEVALLIGAIGISAVLLSRKLPGRRGK